MICMIEIVRNYDFDVLMGYEVYGSLWGYFIECVCFKYDYNFCDEFFCM